MTVSTELIKQLRAMTGAGMMDVKKALEETGGDVEKAAALLRERGIAKASKKADRAAKEGLVGSYVHHNGKIAVLVEVNCETDFVARNAGFVDFVREISQQALETDGALAESLRDKVTAKVVEIGENIVVRRHVRYQLGGLGSIVSYIHMGGKVGVVLELNCTKAESPDQPAFRELARDLSLHVAAANPRYLKSDDVPADELKAEREIYAKQVVDKPAQIVDKIVDGKVKKFYQEICLLDQGFVKEPKQSIQALLDETGKTLGDTLSIRRFTRYQIGA